MIRNSYKHLAISLSFIALSLFILFNLNTSNIDVGKQVAQVGGESKIYYIDATSGNDSNTGLSAELPWKTISKINRSTFNPGDQILFKRGETWREQLTIPSSGSPGSPIVFDAYGSGEKPIISGADVVTGWTQYEGSIYVADLSSITNPTQLYVDGQYYDVAHYPNSGYLIATDDSLDTTSVIDSNLLLESEQIIGATIKTKARAWQINSSIVTTYNAGSHTIGLNGPVYSSNGPFMLKNYGYFFENKLWMLDSAKEWYYDSSAGKLYLWAIEGDDPNNHIVEISSRNYGAYSNRKSYIVFQNLAIKNSNFVGISFDHGCTNINVNNTSISGGIYGIRLYDISNSEIENNLVENVLSLGIDLHGTVNNLNGTVNNSNVNISNNIVNNVGYFGSVMQYNSRYGIGVFGSSINVINNTVTNSGYAGILFKGNLIVVKGNTIDRSCLILDDCAGIYSEGVFINSNFETPGLSNNRIEENTITNSVGNYDGSYLSLNKQTEAHGIYLDTMVHDTYVINNKISNTDDGIRMIGGWNNVVTGNTVYSSRKHGLNLTKLKGVPIWPVNNIRDNNITGNIFETISSSYNATPIYLQSTDSSLSFGIYDNNLYCHSNINLVMTYKKNSIDNNFSYTYYTSLSSWQTFSNQDANSVEIKGPCPSTLPNPIVLTPPASTPLPDTTPSPTPTPDPSLPTPTPNPNPTPTPTPTPPPGGTNGLCGTTLNSCKEGSFSDTEDTSTKYNWSCLGLNGGYTASCSQNKYIQPPSNRPPGQISTKINYQAPTINIPTTTVDISMPKLPSWLDFITAFLLDIANNIIRGVKRTGEVVGI